MNSFMRRIGLLPMGWQPILQQTRSKSNKNMYAKQPKVKTLHYRKAQLLSILQPIYPRPEEEKPMWELCDNVINPKNQVVPLSQYEKVLARDLINRMEHSKFFAVLAHNPLTGINHRRAEVYFGRKQMTLIKFTKRVIFGALTDSVYANLLPLFGEYSYFLFCAEVTVKDMFKITRKYPEYIVLGGYLEGRLMSKTQLDAFAALPNLEASRVKLLSTLNAAALQLVRNIETSQTLLVSHLDSRADELRKSEGSLRDTGATEVSGKETETSSSENKDAQA